MALETHRDSVGFRGDSEATVMLLWISKVRYLAVTPALLFMGLAESWLLAWAFPWHFVLGFALEVRALSAL